MTESSDRADAERLPLAAADAGREAWLGCPTNWPTRACSSNSIRRTGRCSRSAGRRHVQGSRPTEARQVPAA